MEAKDGVRIEERRARDGDGEVEEEVGMWEAGMRWGDGEYENGKEVQIMGWVSGWGKLKRWVGWPGGPSPLFR